MGTWISDGVLNFRQGREPILYFGAKVFFLRGIAFILLRSLGHDIAPLKNLSTVINSCLVQGRGEKEIRKRFTSRRPSSTSFFSHHFCLRLYYVLQQCSTPTISYTLHTQVIVTTVYLRLLLWSVMKSRNV